MTDSSAAEPAGVDALAAWVAGLGRSHRRRPVVVGIDGWSGSGKTTLASMLADRTAATVVHLDDLVAGWHGLAGSVDLAVARVLLPLASGRSAAWPVWDWEADRWGELRHAAATGIVVLEGCGSGAAPARPHLDGLIWIDSPEAERLARLGSRPDWPTYRPWWRTWADQEADLRRGDDPAARADVTVVWADDAPVVSVR